MLKPGIFTFLSGSRFGVPNPDLFFSPHNGPPVVWAFLMPAIYFSLVASFYINESLNHSLSCPDSSPTPTFFSEEKACTDVGKSYSLSALRVSMMVLLIAPRLSLSDLLRIQ